jgi:hypothetical protein
MSSQNLAPFGACSDYESIEIFRWGKWKKKRAQIRYGKNQVCRRQNQEDAG